MDLNTTEYQEIVKSAVFSSSLMRGKFINEVAFLEIAIDIFLSKHFCNSQKDQADFIKIFMPSNIVSFEGKRSVFNKIVELYYPSLAISQPGYYGFMDKVQRLRNKLAHHQLDISPIAMNKFKETEIICFLDSSKESKEYNTTEILELTEKIKLLAVSIVLLKK